MFTHKFKFSHNCFQVDWANAFMVGMLVY